MKKRRNLKVLLACLVIVYAIAFLGSLFTSPNTGPDSEWYQSIRPSITPPNWVFPVVWNVLFFLIALSLYLAWIDSKSIKQKKTLAWIFGINLFVNFLWSVLYFGLKNPAFAFVDLIAIWISIIGMIYVTNKINKTSSYLLIPYFLWVSFAGVLNYLSIP